MNENENIKKDNAELEQSKQYDFDKNTFVVKPVFKENSTDTLGTVLLRLMTDGKYNFTNFQNTADRTNKVRYNIIGNTVYLTVKKGGLYETVKK